MTWFELGGAGGDDLYTELWKACAGPLVEVPRAGERVLYFPQGHMEQVSAFEISKLASPLRFYRSQVDQNMLSLLSIGSGSKTHSRVLNICSWKHQQIRN